jgi:hypothetical protein
MSEAERILKGLLPVHNAARIFLAVVDDCATELDDRSDDLLEDDDHLDQDWQLLTEVRDLLYDIFEHTESVLQRTDDCVINGASYV